MVMKGLATLFKECSLWTAPVGYLLKFIINSSPTTWNVVEWFILLLLPLVGILFIVLTIIGLSGYGRIPYDLWCLRFNPPTCTKITCSRFGFLQYLITFWALSIIIMINLQDRFIWWSWLSRMFSPLKLSFNFLSQHPIIFRWLQVYWIDGSLLGVQVGVANNLFSLDQRDYTPWLG